MRRRAPQELPRILRGGVLFVCAVACFTALAALAGCGGTKPDPQTVTVLIENSPTSLDPRIGIDSQAEHIDELIFDPLVHKNAQLDVEPGVAASWETPDPLTYIFPPAYRCLLPKRKASRREGCEVDDR